jgi:hypothetical protein
MRAKERAYHFRAIARDVIEKIFEDGLPADEEAEVVTAITRQLLTNDGHAGVMTARGQFWLTVVDKADGGWECGVSHEAALSVLRVVRNDDLDADLIPDILHRLTVAQSAEFTSRQGKRMRLWINPKERKTGIEPVADAPESED